MSNTRLLQGDCLRLLPDVPTGSVDMVLADLPYGITCNAWDTPIPLRPLWDELRRVCKKNAAMLFFSQMPFAAELAQSNRKMFRYEWIWQKEQGSGFLNANRMPLRAHENICVFYRSLPTYNPQKRKGEPYRTKSGANTSSNYGKFDGSVHSANSSGDRYPVDVLKYPAVRDKHPTQKPVPLLEYLIRTYTNPGETILDPAMGSGSTGVAAVNAGRNFIGMEPDEYYFDVARERVAEAVRENHG